MRKLILTLILSVGAVCFGLAQRDLGVRPTDSGGALSAEQASYDVLSYDLALKVDPAEKSIEGALIVEARIVQPLRWLVLDLDSPLEVRSVLWLDQESAALDFERSDSQIWIEFPETLQPEAVIRAQVAYGGRPREAQRPPWVGGFIWSKTADGSPWIAVACQVDGADLWWPNKDHSSDEPDQMDLHITVPNGLFVASNGTLRNVEQNVDATRTFHWHVSNPINAYNVSLNIAPYREISGLYRSVAGKDLPMTYWVLPENYEKGLELFRQFPQHLQFLEETLGPYPFLNEKYGVAETPYLGMEHQTVIAYGNNYRDNAYGFDSLHLHELAHEWWGNLLTVADWRDYWIHEGFASYMEALYAERLKGRDALRQFAEELRSRIRNSDPVAPKESRSTVAKYFVPPDYTQTDGDVNHKAALVLHTLRYLIGDQAFFDSLKRFAYPDPPAARQEGCACRFVSTEDFIRVVEDVSGRELDWFFEVYLRQASLPRLLSSRDGDSLAMRWEVPGGLRFPMPVEVKIGDEVRRIEMPNREVTLPLEKGVPAEFDPFGWILKDSEKNR